MLSVTVHKDLTKYKAKVFGSLTTRTMFSVAAAVGIAVITNAFFVFVVKADNTFTQLISMALSIPFWALAFVRPCGMELEQWLPLWVLHNFSSQDVLYENAKRYQMSGLDVPSSLKEKGTYEAARSYLSFARHQKGIELMDFDKE